MSSKGHRTDYVILALLAAFAVAVLLGLTILGLLQSDSGVRATVRSTHSTDPKGIAAYYELLEKLGMPAERCERPLIEDTLNRVDVLFILEPRIPLETGEKRDLLSWLRQGGVLVCTQGEDSLYEFHGIGPPPKPPVSIDGEHLRPPRHRPRPDRSGNESALGETTPGLPLARDVRSLYLSHETIDRDQMPEDGARDLLADRKGLRIAARSVEPGRVIVLADSSLLGNGHLGETDNAVAAVNLAAYAVSAAKGRRLEFDEYHQWGQSGQYLGWEVMARLLVSTRPGYAVLCLTGAALAYLLYRSRRFGTRVFPGRPQRRSRLEYIESIGATLRAAGAHRVTFEAIYRGFKRRVARAVGLTASASSRELAARLAQLTGQNRTRYERVFSESDQALGQPRLKQAELLSLVNRLAGIETEIADDHSRRN